MKITGIDTKMNAQITNDRGRSHYQEVVDSTLRDGEQAPGVVFSLKEKQQILDNLLSIGVCEIELGIPGMGEDERKDVAALVAQGEGSGARLFTWARAHPDDIEACADTGAKAIHIVLPTSRIQIDGIRRSKSTILQQLVRSIQQARKTFEFISIGAQDTTRADPLFLERYIRHAEVSGVHRVRLSDTVGIGTPVMVYEIMRQCISRFPFMEFEFHAHDDFGMASANSLAALHAGAHRVGVTVLGLGERAGNAALEKVVMGAKHLYQLDLGVDTSRLIPLCQMVAEASGRPIPTSQPIVGESVLCHESGIHTQGQLAHPLGFQPFRPSEVGRTRSEFLFGKHSGRNAVREVLRRRYGNIAPELVDGLTEKIKKISRKKKKSFTERDIIEMVRAFWPTVA